MNRTMFYLMSWVREKLEKKQINNETPRHWGGKGERRRRGMGGEERKKKKKRRKKKKGENLVWGSAANRSEGPFEVGCFGAVNSLRTCVIFWTWGPARTFSYLKMPNISALLLPGVSLRPLEEAIEAAKKNSPQYRWVDASARAAGDREILL